MNAVFIKEIKSYYTSITGYITTAIMMLVSGIYIYAVNVEGGSGDFSSTFVNMAFIYFIVLIPIITMKMFAEEKKQKTDQLLYSLPIKTSGVVIGKFLSCCAVTAVPVVLMGLYPLIFSAYGNVNFLSAYSALFGFFMLGASLISIGMFFSSLTESQVVSAIITLVFILLGELLPSLSEYISSNAIAGAAVFMAMGLFVGFIVYFLTKNTVIGLSTAVVIDLAIAVIYIVKKEWLEGLLPSIAEKLSLFSRFNDFSSGVFDLTSIFFFISVTCVFLFLTVQSVEKKRWS
ncbi:MAG: ABC transporter permease subunit [Oscillospiraceae bacterium]|nr:ABC transporter permease subunit [Oscillospiraceae bacterium]MDD7355329.1 ABC transporter permease subunit [Oscillospiraceae bacterium]MDY3938320.1 ABC transporter permease subunit [Oscillospiraceae bacterium]